MVVLAAVTPLALDKEHSFPAVPQLVLWEHMDRGVVFVRDKDDEGNGTNDTLRS